jgi:MoxR-like ATPase
MSKEQISDMRSITISEAMRIVSIMPKDIRTMLWGVPGLGKTKSIQSTFENLIEEEEKEQSEPRVTRVVHVLAGQSEPTDIQGIPTNFKDLYAKYLIPWWAFLSSNAPEVPKEFQGPMVLFFDDIVTAHEQTQAALYKLIDEGYLGELQIRDNVRIIAAGNGVNDMSAVVDMPKALCNRFVHFYVRPNSDAWLEWATKNGIHPHIVYFIRKNPKYISTFDDAKESTETHAWATPRTWEMLSKVLFALEEAGLREIQVNEIAEDSTVNFEDHEYIAAQGCIGKLAIDFLTQIKKEFHAVSIEDILKDPHKAEVPGSNEVDRLFSTVTNLEYWFGQPENHKYHNAIAIYANRLHPEFSILLTRSLVSVVCGSMDENIRNACVESSVFDDLVDRWGDKLQVSY